jgi:hypothetical protein
MEKPLPSKVSLKLLKRLVDELETSLNAAEAHKAASNPDRDSYVVELSKATGFATNIMSEATLLIGDIQVLCHQAQGVGGGGVSDVGDLMKTLMGGTLPKAPKGSAGGSN